MPDVISDVDRFRQDIGLTDVVVLRGTSDWMSVAATRLAQAVVCSSGSDDDHPWCTLRCGPCQEAAVRSGDVIEVSATEFNQICASDGLAGVREAVMIVRDEGRLDDHGLEGLRTLASAAVGPAQIILCASEPYFDLDAPELVEHRDPTQVAEVFPAIKLAWRSSDPQLYLALRTARVSPSTENDVLMIYLSEAMPVEDTQIITEKVQGAVGVVVRCVPLRATVHSVLSRSGFIAVT